MFLVVSCVNNDNKVTIVAQLLVTKVLFFFKASPENFDLVEPNLGLWKIY